MLNAIHAEAYKEWLARPDTKVVLSILAERFNPAYTDETELGEVSSKVQLGVLIGANRAIAMIRQLPEEYLLGEDTTASQNIESTYKERSNNG